MGKIGVYVDNVPKFMPEGFDPEKEGTKLGGIVRHLLEGENFKWTDWLENLEEKEFVKLENDMVWAEEAYNSEQSWECIRDACRGRE